MKTYYSSFSGAITDKTLNNKTFKAKVGREIPDLVKLWIPTNTDPGNPRLWNFIKLLRGKELLKGTLTEDKLVKLVIDPVTGGKIAKGIESLVTGMGESGEPADPILLDANGMAREGFRRVIASRIRKGNGDIRFQSIPVVVLPPEVTEEDWMAHLGTIHINQKASWPSIDRAAACARLRTTYSWNESTIAKHFGWDLSQVSRYLRSYDLNDEYNRETGDYNYDQFTKFWKLAGCSSFYDRMFVAEHADYDPALWAKFKNWVKEGKINDCRHVVEFTSKTIGLLDYDHAMKLVAKAGSGEAIKWVNAQKFSSKNPLVEKAKELEGVLESLDKKSLRSYSSNSGMALRTRASLNSLSVVIKEKLKLMSPDDPDEEGEEEVA